jgi:hypothetical protein
MAKKNKQKQTQQLQARRREERIEKAAIWAAAYQGADAINDYSKEFSVDIGRAIKDLQQLGYGLKQEELDAHVQSMPAKDSGTSETVEEIIASMFETLNKTSGRLFKNMHYSPEEALERIKVLKELRIKREEECFSAYHKTLKELFEDYKRAKIIIYAKRKELPAQIIEYHELDKKHREIIFDRMNVELSGLLGSFDWPPEKVIRDSILKIRCHDCRFIFRWRGPYFQRDIDWGLWLDNYENGVPDEDNICKIEPIKTLVPDSAMNAELDRLIKLKDAEAVEQGRRKIYNWSRQSVDDALVDFANRIVIMDASAVNCDFSFIGCKPAEDEVTDFEPEIKPHNLKYIEDALLIATADALYDKELAEKK